jgi:hypothetical protein
MPGSGDIIRVFSGFFRAGKNDFLKYTPGPTTSMNKRALLVSGLVFILIASVMSAGCTGNSGSSNTTSNSTSVTTFPPGAPHYAAGDIVKNPKVTGATASLIIGYDPATDSYERAIIYPNADGSWGYRKNAITDKETRALFEKVYTEKITNMLPASVPIQTLTVSSTTAPVSTTQTSSTTNTTTTTTTATVSPTGKPTFKNIIPDAGDAGTKIDILSLTGTNFRSGATVMLMMAGNPNITATNVNVQSSTLISCSITPPSNSTAGAWDIVITNPDGQSVTYANIFSIHGSPNAVDTTSPEGSSGITKVEPAFTYGSYQQVIITGTNFQSNFTAKLTKVSGTNEIAAQDARWDSSTQVTCWFPIVTPRQTGTYNVVLTMSDGTIRNLQSGFEVK